MFEYAGLIFELLFLGLGIYMYLFATGVVKFKDPAARERAEQFRKQNHVWMRLLALALIAIMGLNVAIHLASFVQMIPAIFIIIASLFFYNL